MIVWSFSFIHCGFQGAWHQCMCAVGAQLDRAGTRPLPLASGKFLSRELNPGRPGRPAHRYVGSRPSGHWPYLPPRLISPPQCGEHARNVRKYSSSHPNFNLLGTSCENILAPHSSTSFTCVLSSAGSNLPAQLLPFPKHASFFLRHGTTGAVQIRSKSSP